MYVMINLIIKPEMDPESWWICLKHCEQRSPSGVYIFYKYKPPEQTNWQKSHKNVIS